MIMCPRTLARDPSSLPIKPNKSASYVQAPNCPRTMTHRWFGERRTPRVMPRNAPLRRRSLNEAVITEHEVTRTHHVSSYTQTRGTRRPKTRRKPSHPAIIYHYVPPGEHFVSPSTFGKRRLGWPHQEARNARGPCYFCLSFKK